MIPSEPKLVNFINIKINVGQVLKNALFQTCRLCRSLSRSLRSMINTVICIFMGKQTCKTFPDCVSKSFAWTLIPMWDQAESVELSLQFQYYKEQGNNLEIRLQTVDGYVDGYKP